MRIGFLVERPTQFDVPFFRFAAADREHRLRVIYATGASGEARFDPELGREVSWGFELLGGYDHAVLPARGRRRFWRRELARERYDLLITNGYSQRAYLEAAFAARRAGVTTGLRLDSVEFADSWRRRRVKRALYQALLRRLYDLFFGVGTLTARYLAFFGIEPERIAYFTYAVDVESFRRRSAMTAAERRAHRERLGLPAEGPVVTVVAKLNAREAPWDLLAALRLYEGEPPWLAVAGDGPDQDRLEAFTRAHGLSRVRFLGYVPFVELPSLYGASDLFVHAAAEERWGVSVPEAMACGLPVIASSRVGAGHDLVEPGRNGFVYVAGNAAELASRLHQSLTMLAPAEVARTNREVLARWDYAATWRSLLRAAASVER